MVRLAPVTNPDHVPLAAAEALGAPLDGAAVGGPARQRLLTYLAHRELLLVLDNCEHVVDAAARLVDDLLAHCPNVTVLTTTREALAVPGEVQVPLGPLPTPPAGTPPAHVLNYPAAQLFAERARAVRPTLDLTSDDDLAAVADVVVALDGMPLAVELAAARTSTLSPPELAARLTDRFGLLTSGARTADARQRTLRATVDWSHDLLTEPEQIVFRRLAVFHGGWTLDAAEAVAAGPDLPQRDVLDVLSRLVDRHMVTVDDVHPGQPSRYRMLETLRQYAVEKLAAAGEDDEVAAAHVAYFRGLTDAAEWTLRGPGQAVTLRRLRDELPNLRAAFAWLAAGEQDETRVEDALHLAGSLGWFWHFGRHVEGRDVLRHVIALDGGSPAARARALQAVSLVERPRSCPVHPSPRCAETAAESLDLFEQLGDARRAAISRVLLAVEGVSAHEGDEKATRSQALLAAADEQFTADDDAWGHALAAFVRMETYLKTGDAARALPTGRAAAAAFRALNDPWGLSAVLYHLGWGLRQFGRYAEAVPVLEEAIEVSARGGIQNTELWALADLGVALVNLGDLDAARARFDAAGVGSTESGDGAGHVLATYGYALLARVAGDWAQARARYGAALAGFDRARHPVPVGLALAGLGRCDEADGLPGRGPRAVRAGPRHRRHRRRAAPGRGRPGRAGPSRRPPTARRTRWTRRGRCSRRPTPVREHGGTAQGAVRAGRAGRAHRPARRRLAARPVARSARQHRASVAGMTVPGKPAPSRAARTSATAGSPCSTTVAGRQVGLHQLNAGHVAQRSGHLPNAVPAGHAGHQQRQRAHATPKRVSQSAAVMVRRVGGRHRSVGAVARCVGAVLTPAESTAAAVRVLSSAGGPAGDARQRLDRVCPESAGAPPEPPRACHRARRGRTVESRREEPCLPQRLPRATAAGGRSASSPPPSSWSSWTRPSSAWPCRRCRPTWASPPRTCRGCSTPTWSRSAGCCCSAAACRTCSAPARCSSPAGPSCSPGRLSPAPPATPPSSSPAAPSRAPVPLSSRRPR